MPGWTRSPASSSAKRDTVTVSVRPALPAPPLADVQSAAWICSAVAAQSCALGGDPRDRAVTAQAGAHSGVAARGRPLRLAVTRPAGVRTKAALLLAWPHPSVGPREHPTPPHH